MTLTKNVWKAAAFLLILCLVSAVMISGTYAKYTSEFAGEDTALVAKWDVIGSGDSIFTTTGAGIDLNLFSHAYNKNIKTTGGALGQDYIIAPGVAGHFTIQFNNNSDVAAKVTFQMATTSGIDVPIKYGFTTDSAIHDIDWLVNELNTASTSSFAAIAVGATGPTAATETIYWSWPYEAVPSDDIHDTDLGVASYISDVLGHGRTVYGLAITATAIQLTPGQ